MNKPVTHYHDIQIDMRCSYAAESKVVDGKMFIFKQTPFPAISREWICFES